MKLGGVAALAFTVETAVALLYGLAVLATTTRDNRERRIDLAAPLLLLLLAATLRWPGGHRFLGNEYEDSYEYIAASWLTPSIDSLAQLPFNQVCALGTAIDCNLSSTTAHPGGLAALIWSASAIGPSIPRESIARLTSYVAATLTVPVLYLVAVALGCGRLAAATSGFVLAVMPLAIVYSSVPTPEAISTIVSTVLVGVWFSALQPVTRRSFFNSAIAAAVLLFTASMLRRDHLVLALALPMSALAYRALAAKPHLLRKFMATSTALALSAALVSLVLDPERAGMGSVSENAGRFSLGRIASLAPRFLVALAEPGWTLLLPAFVFAAFLRRDFIATTASLFVILASYVALFAAFDQDYYFAHTGLLSEAHVLRYSTQVLPIAALLAGVGISAAISLVVRITESPRVAHAVLALGGCMLTATSFVVSNSARVGRASSERELRFAPATQVLDLVPRSSLVVSAEPLVLQVLSDGTQAVADFRLLGSYIKLGDAAEADLETFYFRQAECEGISYTRFESQCSEILPELRSPSFRVIAPRSPTWEVWQLPHRSIVPRQRAPAARAE